MGACGSRVDVTSKLLEEMNPAVLERYNIDFAKGALGEGMAGTVWHCTEKSTGTHYAIKVMNLSALDAEQMADMGREIEILNKLQHPNILRYREHFKGEKSWDIITEVISGGELFEAIIEQEHYTEVDGRELVRILLGALKYMHDRQIVHRDIKPENIMLTQKGGGAKKRDLTDIKLVDFGLSPTVPDELTGIVTAAGTPEYLAPEMLVGTPNAGKPVDVWATGVVAFILLCGYPPFYSETGDPEDLYAKIGQGIQADTFDPDDWENVSPEAQEFIRACLVLDAAKRPSVGDLLLHEWMMSGKVQTKDLGKTQAEMKRMQARKKLKAGMAAIMMLNRGKATKNVVMSEANPLTNRPTLSPKSSFTGRDMLQPGDRKLSFSESPLTSPMTTAKSNNPPLASKIVVRESKHSQEDEFVGVAVTNGRGSPLMKIA